MRGGEGWQRNVFEKFTFMNFRYKQMLFSQCFCIALAFVKIKCEKKNYSMGHECSLLMHY